MKEGMLEIQLDQPSSILKRRFVVLRPNKLAYYYYPTVCSILFYLKFLLGLHNYNNFCKG